MNQNKLSKLTNIFGLDLMKIVTDNLYKFKEFMLIIPIKVYYREKPYILTYLLLLSPLNQHPILYSILGIGRLICSMVVYGFKLFYLSLSFFFVYFY